MELPGKRTRGRHQRRCMDAASEDMTGAEMTEEVAEDRTEWRWKIDCGDPIREKPKEEEPVLSRLCGH